MPPNSSIIREAGRLARSASKQMASARSSQSVTVTLAPFVFLSGLTRISVPLNQTLLPPQSASCSGNEGGEKKKAEKKNQQQIKKNLLPLIRETDGGRVGAGVGGGALSVDG